MQRIHYIIPKILRSVVDNAVLRFQFVGEKDGEYTENFLSKS